MDKNVVRKHTDLIAWQLCSLLRRLVLRYTRTGAVSRDYDYRRQLRRSVRSACYLTSEGFYRYKHGEFGHYLNMAHGSLGEALDQLDDGRESNYFSEEKHIEMKRICLRAMKANVALRKSWGNSEAPPASRSTCTSQHPSASVSTRQHPSASVSTRQHPSAPVSTSQHPSAPVSTSQHPSAPVSTSQHPSAPVSTPPHPKST